MNFRPAVPLALLFTLVCTPNLASQVAQTSSFYVPTADGTRLAVDVHLPVAASPRDRFPALLEITRYWRASEDPATGDRLPSLNRLDRTFLEHGYALVKVDVRGSGASFGTRPVEYGPQEVRDGYDVVDWVVAQTWSDGNVGAYGTSYTGTTAELLAGVQHPAVKAVIPGWSDFDVYVSPVRPYGVVANSLIVEWSRSVGWLDENSSSNIGAAVRRVDGDGDGVLLSAALLDHESNPDVNETIARAEFRDDVIGSYTYDSLTSLHWRSAIEGSGTPMLVLASWLDAGTAAGALLRFQHYSNPQKVVILASNHGGRFHASPFVVGTNPARPAPSEDEQFQMRVAFFDHYLKNEDRGVDEWPAVRYFNLGEEAYRETDVWPPRGSRTERWYFDEGNMLSTDAPTSSTGADEYTVDYTVSTGTTNRWSTQMGGPVLNLHDRGAMDAKMLTYTTAALESDIQITGRPVMHLQISSDHDDGLVLAYLEVVDPDGTSRYVTEGGLRAVHRRTSQNPHFDQTTPFHSFKRVDAAPLVPGEVADIAFELWPTSVLVRAGQRIRIGIAGADRDNFSRLPSAGTPVITLYRNTSKASFIELPVIDR